MDLNKSCRLCGMQLIGLNDRIEAKPVPRPWRPIILPAKGGHRPSLSPDGSCSPGCPVVRPWPQALRLRSTAPPGEPRAISRAAAWRSGAAPVAPDWHGVRSLPPATACRPMVGADLTRFNSPTRDNCNYRVLAHPCRKVCTRKNRPSS